MTEYSILKIKPYHLVKIFVMFACGFIVLSLHGRTSNVTMATDAYGRVTQHTDYPYGEPWREPAGQPRLYGGKERLRDNALRDYDFAARRLQSCLWTTFAITDYP